ncbi:LamG domain-containing protein [Puia sp.]|jgi:hypothetical protein|uniref:LamG domain-containing protein n=1 Tax=Puia sp. TaxID=2045100 RepID=UPI002F41A85E
MRKCYTFLLVSLCLSLTAFSQNSSLNLTGANNMTAGVDVIPVTGNFAVEFWVYVPHSTNDGDFHTMISEGQPGLAFSIGLASDGTVQVGDPAAWPSTGFPMPFDTWTHIALSFDQADINGALLYVNGKYITNVAGFFFNDDQPFRIGVQTDLTQPLVGRIDEVKVWNTPRSAALIKSDMFGVPNNADNTLNAYYNMNDGSNTIVTNSADFTGSLQNGSINGDVGGLLSWQSSPIQYGNNALVFDGVDDQVDIPALADKSYDLSSGGTVEFWVNPSTLPTSGWSTIFGNRGPGGVRYSIQLSASQIGIDNGTTVNTLNYAVPAGTNTWTHMAFVMDGSNNTLVYVAGQPLATIVGTPGGGIGQPVTLGISKNISGPDNNPFTGGIDEVRIWKTQRSAAEILANRDNTLNGTETDLIGQFTFDQGASNGDDDGFRTALDNSNIANHGTLANFALTGTTSNFTLHNLTGELPVTLTAFTAVRSGNDAVLQWKTATEENTSEFIIERSADGKKYTDVGNVPAAGNSKTMLSYSYIDPKPGRNSIYYRLKQVDLDGNYVFSSVRLINFPANDKLIWYPTGKGTAEVLLQHGGSEPYTLFDAGGHLLRMGQLANGKAQISQLPPGIYYFHTLLYTTAILLP